VGCQLGKLQGGEHLAVAGGKKTPIIILTDKNDPNSYKDHYFS
jgi:hypothetical protein